MRVRERRGFSGSAPALGCGCAVERGEPARRALVGGGRGGKHVVCREGEAGVGSESEIPSNRGGRRWRLRAARAAVCLQRHFQQGK